MACWFHLQDKHNCGYLFLHQRVKALKLQGLKYCTFTISNYQPIKELLHIYVPVVETKLSPHIALRKFLPRGTQTVGG